MQNVFLIIRTIFLVSMFTWSLLLLVFSSWNIAATRSSGMPVPGSAVFLIFNSCFLCFFIFIAFAGVFCPRGRGASVRFESGWTVIMSVLQLTASLDVTINGPPTICRMNTTWGACASASLLVPTSWIASFITVTYFLTLFITTAYHLTTIPAVWSLTVYTVPWFSPNDQTSSRPVYKRDIYMSSTSSVSTTDEDVCRVGRYIADRWGKIGDIEKQPPSCPILFSPGVIPNNTNRPTWAQGGAPTRRGVDQPFAVRPRLPPPVPPKAQQKDIVTPKDTRSVESDREANAAREYRLGVNPPTPPTPTAFPPKIADPNQPIAKPRLSKWVTADHYAPSSLWD